MEKGENNIDLTLKSTESIKSVPVSDDLMLRLRSIPGNVKELYDKVPKKVVWSVAASIAVLVILNFISLKEYAENADNSTSQETEIYFDYLNQL